MSGYDKVSLNRGIVTDILDTAFSPVAKMRLLSGGMAPNNLLMCSNEAAGQKACIACGNCIDACPVVLREVDKVEMQTDRNSLHLEEIVGESCIRCYRCVRACPQVDRPIKMVATKNRIYETIFHWWLAIAYLLTAASGILLNHFREDWTGLFLNLGSAVHKIGAIMWLLSPVLFYIFDRKNFRRMGKAIVSFNGKDWGWWKERFKFWFAKGKRNFEGEYNSGQKIWYFVIFGTMLVLGVTGIIRWIWEPVLPEQTLNIMILIHIIAAYCIDISFIYHFGRKALFRLYRRTRHIFVDTADFN